jgi:hypothetical protein
MSTCNFKQPCTFNNNGECTNIVKCSFAINIERMELSNTTIDTSLSKH